MKYAHAIIGAGFGDEGKGASVDWLASQVDHPIVVRSNGGAQAGHTVVTPDGRRHVFSHFGSGTLVGAPTLLSRFFVVNPKVFLNERKELGAIVNNSMDVYIDPEAQVTLPYDIMVNRWLEEDREMRRHGSCGIGFGATIERGLFGVKLIARHAFKPGVEAIINQVRAYYRRQLSQFGLIMTEERMQFIDDDSHIDQAAAELREMNNYIKVIPLKAALEKSDTIIFEGAQGLLLDQEHGYMFPHLTRSNTGLKNIIRLGSELGLIKLSVHYVTRAYTTRHGAGPLVGEVNELHGIKVNDETNKEGLWQGSLRLAPLMYGHMLEAIERDLRYANSIDVSPNLVVTCMDHIKDDNVREQIRHKIYMEFPIRFYINETWGPTRLDRYTFGVTNKIGSSFFHK